MLTYLLLAFSHFLTKLEVSQSAFGATCPKAATVDLKLACLIDDLRLLNNASLSAAACGLLSMHAFSGLTVPDEVFLVTHDGGVLNVL